MSSENITETSDLATCTTKGGEELRGTVKRLTPHSVCFEIYELLAPLQTSEVLVKPQIAIGERTCYTSVQASP